MRTIEEIDKDLLKAREELADVQGAPAEVYSRIVGYYRSVRNWNKGKKEEYGERKLFELSDEDAPRCVRQRRIAGPCNAGPLFARPAPAEAATHAV
jgi:hypothetical protein